MSIPAKGTDRFAETLVPFVTTVPVTVYPNTGIRTSVFAYNSFAKSYPQSFGKYRLPSHFQIIKLGTLQPCKLVLARHTSVLVLTFEWTCLVIIDFPHYLCLLLRPHRNSRGTNSRRWLALTILNGWIFTMYKMYYNMCVSTTMNARAGNWMQRPNVINSSYGSEELCFVLPHRSCVHRNYKQVAREGWYSLCSATTTACDQREQARSMDLYVTAIVRRAAK